MSKLTLCFALRTEPWTHRWSLSSLSWPVTDLQESEFYESETFSTRRELEALVLSKIRRNILGFLQLRLLQTFGDKWIHHGDTKSCVHCAPPIITVNWCFSQLTTYWKHCVFMLKKSLKNKQSPAPIVALRRWIQLWEEALCQTPSWSWTGTPPYRSWPRHRGPTFWCSAECHQTRKTSVSRSSQNKLHGRKIELSNLRWVIVAKKKKKSITEMNSWISIGRLNVIRSYGMFFTEQN